MPSGLLLAFPLESVAVRLALALGVALLLLRVVSSWDLRSPRARSTLAVAPFVVAATVLVLSSGDLGLPSLLVPSGAGAGALAIPVADRYLDFAPVAPFVVGLWASISLALIGLRLGRTMRFRREVLSDAYPAEPRVAAVVLRLARSMGITPPRVLVVRDRIGGAAVLGIRDPLLLIDAVALARLDDEELEGVVAHELAHVARRDNLVAWAVSIVRDVSFFVPGGRWAVHALHREREAAADLDAVGVTGRPAALASGLLRVLELDGDARAVPHGCAALVPKGSVVDRVELLLSDDRPTAKEHRVELALAAAVSLVAVALALVLPSSWTGEQGQRDALGLLFGSTSSSAASEDTVATIEGRVFSVYRSAGRPEAGAAAPTREQDIRPVDLIGPEDRPGMADACAAVSSGCRTHAASNRLALRPAPIVLLDEPVATRWQATPVSEVVSGDRFAVYWLTRLDAVVRGG
jgi:beta-lactamase regulating signal transducer with metallopeptidase domain